VAEFLGETNLLEGRANGSGVSTDAGSFQTSGTSPLVEGVAVLLSIRPEAWRLDSSRAALNSFPGRIRETVYLGEMARHRFALETGRELTVFELNPRPRTQDALFYATVDPADVIPILEP
jgi:ABC-type Fe3+/spermidine/putrescine transport system ATPase subunit